MYVTGLLDYDTVYRLGHKLATQAKKERLVSIVTDTKQAFPTAEIKPLSERRLRKTRSDKGVKRGTYKK